MVNYSLSRNGVMKRRMWGCLCVVFMLTVLPYARAGIIATFSDPALSPSTPMFTIDTADNMVRGGWSDGLGGLKLKFPAENVDFTNVFFTMTDLTYTSGVTGAGKIKFFAQGSDVQTASPLFEIDFSSANVSFGGLSGNNVFLANGVVFSGSQINSGNLTQQVFSFAFADLAALPNNGGYTATAAFTSSAVAAPEPTTLLVLGAGLLFLKKRN
jgi:hypothetical protein